MPHGRIAGAIAVDEKLSARRPNVMCFGYAFMAWDRPSPSGWFPARKSSRGRNPQLTGPLPPRAVAVEQHGRGRSRVEAASPGTRRTDSNEPA